MPDLSQIVGRPLPDRGMPTGTVSVRVARKMPANAVAGAEVSAIIKNAGGDLRRRALQDRRQRPRPVRGDGAGRRVPRRGDRRRRAPADRAFTMPVGGRHPHDADLGRRERRRRPPARSRRARPPPAKRRRRAAGKDSARFALGATAGVGGGGRRRCPSGRWRSACATRADAPIANHPVAAGHGEQAGRGRRQARRQERRRPAPARFTGLPAGKQTGYAAVIEWHGLRLNTSPFAMPDSGGARAEIRALARTADPSVITIGAGGADRRCRCARTTLQILEFLPLENTSDKMFDPGAGRARDPAAHGVRGRAAAGERAQDRGAAEPRRRRARPDRPQALAARRGRQRAPGQRSGVRLRAPLPRRHARLLAADAERHRTDDADHRPEGRGPDGQRPGRRARARSACWAGTSTG